MCRDEFSCTIIIFLRWTCKITFLWWIYTRFLQQAWNYSLYYLINALFFSAGGQTIHWLDLVETFLQRQRPLKCVPNCQNNLSTKASFFSDWWKSHEWSWNLIHMACWWLIVGIVFLIVFRLYCCSIGENCLRRCL